MLITQLHNWRCHQFVTHWFVTGVYININFNFNTETNRVLRSSFYLIILHNKLYFFIQAVFLIEQIIEFLYMSISPVFPLLYLQFI